MGIVRSVELPLFIWKSGSCGPKYRGGRFHLPAQATGAARRSGALGGDAHGRLSPKLLKAIEIARLRSEDVNDHVEVVHKHPLRLSDAIHPPGQQTVIVLAPLVNRIVDRPH